MLKEMAQEGVLTFKTELSPGLSWFEMVFKIVLIDLQGSWQSILGYVCYNQGSCLSIHDDRQSFVMKEDDIRGLYDSYHAHLKEEERKENVRKAPLARLTDEEKNLLGLK